MKNLVSVLSVWNTLYLKEKKMKNELYYFLAGFMSMFIIALVALSWSPEPETEAVCLECGSQEWWFQIADDD